MTKASAFAIVRARFNHEITDALHAGALRAFADRAGRARVETFEVPGAFELPLAALWLARSGAYAAVVCLGCVIRGETPHFEYVAGESARGIAYVALATGVPVIFGVLTTENAGQAWARAGKKRRGTASHTAADPAGGNKGYEAAVAAIEMAALRKKLRVPRM
ncbi:MAG TPA: 6,7-dimethyl-8-ribityllumazine synthase [Candidatus Eremiobacteraceae bacterium]|nr:6,7-dimethyl-8-ribityllumazine synthase [Candidatus Eremiobacteraceae bacterium]